jgi:CPA2 family monovalent cation:H+ antiporter-2
VIIILFHIGLEFDFNKLKEVGSTAIVSALVKMGGVLGVGYAFGLILGMTKMDSIFLGAMLSISSTVVIQKCFSEMGLEKEKYAGLVMGSLVMEDVIAVFMMVVLTTISGSSDGGGSPVQMLLMITYLILWLILGIFFLPTILDRTMGLMSDETLTLLSIGFCFLMALLANWLGFSMELGAFVAGSLFAGTRHAHKVERVTAGIKDMFGAVFFLSVGLMVDPTIIIQRWTTIIPIAILAVIAKQIFATIGMMLSGQDIETSMKGGVALAPIGEFSFIIASLGISLGVMDRYLYPVIVAASIITIIATPVLIKQSDKAIGFITSKMPEKFRRRLDDYTSEDRVEEEGSSDWKELIKEFFFSIIVYGSIMLVLTLFNIVYVQPALEGLIGAKASKAIVITLIYVMITLFAVPYMRRRSVSFTNLWMERLSNRPPLVVMTIVKILLLEFIAVMPLLSFYNIGNILIVLLVPLSILYVSRTDLIATYYLQLETRFLANLNQKTMEERGGERDKSLWLDEDYNIFSWVIPEGAPYANTSIKDLHWGRQNSVYVVKVKKGDRRIPMPPSRTVLQEGDRVHAIGEKKYLRAFIRQHDIEDPQEFRTLREFLEAGYDDEENALECTAIKVRGTESYVGKPIRRSGINHHGHCLILGIERDGYATKLPDSNMMIEEGDILWLVGTNRSLRAVVSHSVGEAGIHEKEEAAAE